MARLISCSVCGRVHAKDYICAIKKRRKLDRVDTGVYNRSKWRTVRWQVLEECNYICLYTLYKENKIVKAECVHHIVEVLEDNELAYDEDNLIALTNEKHKLIHELYKGNKAKIQEELREIKDKWKQGDRGKLGSPPYIAKGWENRSSEK